MAILGLIAALQIVSVALVAGGLILFVGVLVRAERRRNTKDKS